MSVDVTPSSTVSTRQRHSESVCKKAVAELHMMSIFEGVTCAFACCLLNGFFLVLLLGLENGGDMFLRNVG
jgi:hypothetical protein